MNAIRLVALGLLVVTAVIVAPANALTLLSTVDTPKLHRQPQLSVPPAGAVCVMPWATDGDETLGAENYWGLEPTQLYLFRTSELVTPGDLGALALYGAGALDYSQAITTPCAGGDRGACDQTDPRVWVGETLECELQPGSIGQITYYALTKRYGEGSDCDVTTYADAVTQAATGLCQDRAVFTPIVDAWPTPGLSAPIQILGIAPFYIAGWDRNGPFDDADLNGDTIPDGAMVWGYYLLEIDRDSDQFSDFAELHIGTDPLDNCPDTLGSPGLCPGPSCDGHDAWVPDLDIDRDVDIADVLKFKALVLAGFPCYGHPSYDNRFDFNANGCINIADVLQHKPLINQWCTNP